MKTKNLLLLAALTTGTTLGSLALAPSAEAIAFRYTLSGVTYSGLESGGGDAQNVTGGTVTGSFVYDPDLAGNATKGYSDINLTVSE